MMHLPHLDFNLNLKAKYAQLENNPQLNKIIFIGEIPYEKC